MGYPINEGGPQAGIFSGMGHLDSSLCGEHARNPLMAGMRTCGHALVQKSLPIDNFYSENRLICISLYPQATRVGFSVAELNFKAITEADLNEESGPNRQGHIAGMLKQLQTMSLVTKLFNLLSSELPSRRGSVAWRREPAPSTPLYVLHVQATPSHRSSLSLTILGEIPIPPDGRRNLVTSLPASILK